MYIIMKIKVEHLYTMVNVFFSWPNGTFEWVFTMWGSFSFIHCCNRALQKAMGGEVVRVPFSGRILYFSIKS